MKFTKVSSYMNLRRFWMFLGTAACVGLSFLPVTSAAMPYCALRDPIHQIYGMFPTATSFRSIVHTVNEKARERVSSELPFSLHSRELGEHTLYVPLEKALPLGIVHSRSEASEWGLVEITWAFDMDLHIRDFRFQRCRGPGCETLSTGAFVEAIRGRTLTDVKNLLSDDGSSLRHSIPGVVEDDARMAVTVLRSAAKTIAVTEFVWGSDITVSR